MEAASGYYLNLYDNKYGSWDAGRDVFILFNEANSEPTGDELNALIVLVEQELEKNPGGETLQEVVENSGLECVAFGVQIRADGLKPRSLDNQIQQAAGKKMQKASKNKAPVQQQR